MTIGNTSSMKDYKNHNTVIAKNTILLSIRMLVVLFINLYSTRIILQQLGVDDYGIYNVVCGFVSLLSFLNTSLSNGIQRFYNYEYSRNGLEGANNVFCISLIIQICLIILIVLLAETIGLWYINNVMVIPIERFDTAKIIYQLSIINFSCLIIQSPFVASVMAHERMGLYAIVSMWDSSAKLLAAISLTIISSDKLVAYSLLVLLITFVDLLIYVIYAKCSFKEIYFNRKLDIKLLKPMLSFSGWNVFGSFSGIMKEQGINLLLNIFYGPVVNAARAVASQVSAGLQSFINNFTVPARPQIIQSYASGDLDRTMGLTYEISKLSTFFLYVISVPIIFELNFILSLWLGENIPEYSNIFIIIIILTTFVNNLNSSISGVVHASGKMKVYQLSTSLVALLSIPLSYLALYLGAAPQIALWMVFVTMIFVQIVALLVLKTIVTFSIKEYLRKVIYPFIRVILSSIWLPFVITYFMEQSILRFFILSLSFILISFLLIYFIGVDDKERYMFKTLIVNKINNLKK